MSNMSWELFFNPTTTEGKSTELVVDLSKECLSFWISNGNFLGVKVLHIMTAIITIVDSSFTSGPEGLNGKELAFFHPSCISAFDNRYTLTCVDLVGGNGMAAQILHTLYLKSFFSDSYLMRFHNFLDCFSNITQSHVDTSCLDALICSFLNSFQEWIELWVEGHSKCAIDNLAVYLSTEINLHHIIVVQNSLISWVWGVMSSARID
jgi:hypothetical protein